MEETRLRVTFTVYGIAQPAGSKRVVPRGGKRGGAPIVVDAAKGSAPWKRQVAQVAGAAMGSRALLEGPLELSVRVFVPRPKSHYGTGRNAGQVKASAPDLPITKPDTTKLVRGVEDACTGIVWRDDAQITDQWVGKRYGEPARAEVHVFELGPRAGEVAAGGPIGAGYVDGGGGA